MSQTLTHSSHWGGFTVVVDDGEVAAVHPLHDPDPSPLLRNLPGSVRHAARIEQPVARRGWLERGPGSSRDRGNDSFVTLSWDEAWDRAADELERVIAAHGNEAIFGGSYGWASAGLFHQSQRQLHRFLNLIGGFTSSRNSYSIGASIVLLPHVVGSAGVVFRKATSWTMVARHTELLVAFGGIPIKNTFVAPGGMARHGIRHHLADGRRRGMEIAVFSPLRDDVVAEAEARWYPLVPLSDVAVMLALAHVLITEGLHDAQFLERYCHGANHFIAYVLGEPDGVAKSPEWAEARSGIAADDLRALARRMAASRTLITVSYSLQRAEHGEQPVWAAIALAALLGSDRSARRRLRARLRLDGRPRQRESRRWRCRRFPQGRTRCARSSPWRASPTSCSSRARPSTTTARRHTYPDIRLVYWAGGNPFHHHQDLNRLRRALARPDTIIVHEPYWTPMARHADLVFPATTTFERNDIGSGRADARIIAMHQSVPRVGGALSDHDILEGLAERLGVGGRLHRGPRRAGLVATPLHRAPRRAPQSRHRGALLRGLLGRRVARDARSRSRARALRHLSRRSRGPSAAHAQWQDRAVLRTRRELRLRRLPRTSDLDGER